MTDPKPDLLNVRSGDRSVQWAKWHAERDAERKAADAQRREEERRIHAARQAADAEVRRASFEDRLSAVEKYCTDLADEVHGIVTGVITITDRFYAEQDRLAREQEKEIGTLRETIAALHDLIKKSNAAWEVEFKFAREREREKAQKVEDVPAFIPPRMN
jgi:hypothetical protein